MPLVLDSLNMYITAKIMHLFTSYEHIETCYHISPLAMAYELIAFYIPHEWI